MAPQAAQVGRTSVKRRRRAVAVADSAASLTHRCSTAPAVASEAGLTQAQRREHRRDCMARAGIPVLAPVARRFAAAAAAAVAAVAPRRHCEAGLQERHSRSRPVRRTTEVAAVAEAVEQGSWARQTNHRGSPSAAAAVAVAAVAQVAPRSTDSFG